MPAGQRYDLEKVRSAAMHQWPVILSRLAGIDTSYLTGKHGPCPKCSNDPSDDRWRFSDLGGCGSSICNQCGKNGDGFGVIQWFLGKPFLEVLAMVADFLGIAPEDVSTKNFTPAEPDKRLAFTETLPPAMAAIWCSTKKPISVQSLMKVGARYATYRKRYPVIALPGVGRDGKITAWVVYHARGKELPIYEKGNKEPVEWKKIKNTSGSRAGWIGPKIDDSIHTIWKVEGPSDLLAITGILPDGHAAVCNIFGAGEDPASNPWLLDIFKDRMAYVIHDCDEPGQNGATEVKNDQHTRAGWAPAIANVAKETRNVVLPFPIEKKDGKDLRDWLNLRMAEGLGSAEIFMQLHELAKRADVTKSIQLKVSQQSKVDSLEEAEAIDDPHRLARLNLRNYETEHKRSIRYWKETWFTWKRGQYEPMTQDHFETGLNKFIRLEFERAWKVESEKYTWWKASPGYDKKEDKGPPKIRKVTYQLVRNVLQATKSYCALRNSQELHAWTDGHDEGYCTAVENGILNISKAISTPSPPDGEILLPHTPEWFSTIRLRFSFDPRAQCPNWVKFLNEVFSSDEESIGVLQRWFGYLLTPDNSLQKILFVIGQPRSGKGTILHVMKSLFGESNIATPKLFELAQQYSLHSLVGKTIAVITDARLSEHADESMITERLLSISGGDPQDISRKYKDALTGYDLKVRFTLFSNLLPRIKDQSGAFISRCVFLRMPNTFLGREDLTLRDRLLAELPGILNWAIMGRHYLNSEKRLVQPASGRVLLEDMTEIVSPVMDFLKTQCDFNPEFTEPTKNLFSLWEKWCDENDISHAGTIQSFCRKVKATSHIATNRTSVGSIRSREFVGLRLKPGVGY